MSVPEFQPKPVPGAAPNPSPATPLSTGPIVITGPLSIPELLDRTFRALRARFGVLTLSAAITMIPIGVLTLLLSGRFMTSYMELLEYSLSQPTVTDAAIEQFFGDIMGYFGAVMLMTLLYLVGSTMVTLLSMHHIRRFLHGESSTIAEGFQAALRRFLPLIWMQILQFLAIGFVTTLVMVVVGILLFGVALVFGGAISALDNEAAGVFLVAGLVIVFIVGYLLLILLLLAPALLFMGRWVAAAPILMLEGLGPVQSLQRSWALTKGRMWRGILFVALLTIFSYVVIGMPMGMVQWIAMVAMPSQLVLVGMISTVVGYAINLFYQPFYATGTVLFYYDLRVRSEAYDVALRVAALEAELSPDAPPS